MICILILINHNVLKTILVHFQNIFFFIKQLKGFKDKIIKIKSIILLHSDLIFSVNTSHLFFTKISKCICIQIFRKLKFFFRLGNSCKALLLRKLLIIYSKTLQNFFNNRFLIICVIDCKVIISSDAIIKPS